MKIIKFFTLIYFTFFIYSISYGENFNTWKNDFKNYAINKGVTKATLDNYFMNSRYLPNVIKYDRFQPEFYEDTKTYISKRTSQKKVIVGKNLYNKNKDTIKNISDKFSVDESLLLSLMGIETNFGSYLGKMDIISSLATLSYDKRRSEFFSSELIILLKLIDDDKVDPLSLYGSWAGAFGNFQFMPRTIRNYAIDYNNNKTIELKNIEDSFASAANYLKTIGWKKNAPCFFKVELKDNIPKKYLNSSARNIKNKKKISFFKKYIKNNDNLMFKDNDISAAIIIPDKDIIPGAETLSPAFIIFDNYEKILNWNRSLRFALAVCTLKESFENEI